LLSAESTRFSTNQLITGPFLAGDDTGEVSACFLIGGLLKGLSGYSAAL
jgi:hypothetical protein